MMRKLDWKLQKKAMKEKLATLKEARMEKLVNTPISVNIVNYRQIFKTKKNVIKNIVCYKACLAIQGFS